MAGGLLGREMDCWSLRKLWSGVVILTLGCAASLHAQNPAEDQKPQPKPALPSAQDEVPQQQQLGVPKSATTLGQAEQVPREDQRDSGAQVRTGSAVGSGEGDLPARMTLLLGDHQFLEMQRLLEDLGQNSTEAKAKISPEQVKMYRGLLANRMNRSKESIDLLEPVLEEMKAKARGGAEPTEDEKLVRKTLAEDYLRGGDLGKAAGAYREMQVRLGSRLSADEAEEMELPLKLLPLAEHYPAMTVEAGDPFALPYNRNPLGLADIPVFVDGQSHDWMLDPTAPFNLICRSTAKEVGLRLSEQSATVHSITGSNMVVHATLIPRFTIGTVTYRNMTAFVFDDADYVFARTGYRVRGVLGYPAVSALGSVTIAATSKIEVQPGEKGERLNTGAPFFLDGDRVMVALGKPGDERMFQVDAGGQQTYMSSRYFAEHADEFEGRKMQLAAIPGAEKTSPAGVYVADSVSLLVGGTKADFHFMQVLTQPLGSAAVDDSYGVLGLDALDALKSYTFDYRTMRFAVKTAE